MAQVYKNINRHAKNVHGCFFVKNNQNKLKVTNRTALKIFYNFWLIENEMDAYVSIIRPIR